MTIDRVKVFKALADDSRLRIVESLFDENLSVSEIAEITGIEYSQVSHHLGVLRNAGIVNDRRAGKFIVYGINPDLLSREHRSEHILDFNCCTIELSDNKSAYGNDNKF